jgi:uncharacterized membrane protein
MRRLPVNNTRRVFRFWLLGAVAVSAIVLLTIVAPLAAAGNYPRLALTLYRAFAALCHQLPERSYFIAGHKLAICSRCTGLYAGFAFTLLLYPLIRSLRTTIWPPREWLLLAAAPMAIDFSLTFFGIWENTHTSRLLTGLLLGSVTVFYVMPGLVELSSRNVRGTRSTFTLASPELMASAPSDYSAPDRRI